MWHWPGYNPVNSQELVGPPQRAEAPGGITISSGSMSCSLPGAYPSVEAKLLCENPYEKKSHTHTINLITAMDFIHIQFLIYVSKKIVYITNTQGKLFDLLFLCVCFFALN